MRSRVDRCLGHAPLGCGNCSICGLFWNTTVRLHLHPFHRFARRCPQSCAQTQQASMKLTRLPGQVDASVVVVLKLVADNDDHNIRPRLDLDECNVARPPEGNDQFAQERALSDLAACER